MTRSLIALMLVIGCSTACAKSEEQKQVEQAQARAERMRNNTDRTPPASSQTAEQNMQQGAQQMMQGMQQMAGQPGQTPVKLIEYTVLKDMIPELSGWERSGLKGQQSTMIVSVSNAEAQYKKDDASMRLEITDVSFSQAMIVPFAMFMRAGYEQKSDNGYKKAISVSGNPGFEEWDKRAHHAQVTLVVGNRYLVQADGRGVDDAGPAQKLVEAVNLTKLAGLK